MSMFSHFIVWFFVLYVFVEAGQTFTDITNKVFAPNSQGYIAAYADYNSDKMTDIFVITRDGRNVDLYLARNDAVFESRTIITDRWSPDTRITCVMPADFDGDSQTDVLITVQKAQRDVDVEIYWGDGGNGSLASYTSLPHTLHDQPLVLDSNGDLIPDLFGETNDTERFFYYFGADHSVTYQALTNGSESGRFPRLHNYQSSAFVDWDSNLTPDLLITSIDDDGQFQIEVWVAADGSFVWNETIRGPDVNVSPDHIGVMSVSCIDETNRVDIILPLCLDAECKQSCIYLYNHTQWIKLPVTFTDSRHTWGFVSPRTNDWYLKLPVMMRFGDLNMDGYTDYLVTLRSCVDASSCFQKAFVLINRKCEQEECASFGRTFSLLSSAPISPDPQHDLIPSFFDTSENGKLDVFVTSYTNTPSLKAYRYTSDFGSYFLKIMVVSGKCRQPCNRGDKSLGVNLPGPTTYYETLKSNGDSQVGIATQMSQSAYLALQLPYVIYGLGQAPNAVDKLMAGVAHNGSMADLNRTWTYVVPNTQMIIIPYPQDEPSYWKTRLFMTPSQLVLLTAAALSGTFGFIIIIVALLHWREYVVDKREKLQESQKFHFDAM